MDVDVQQEARAGKVSANRHVAMFLDLCTPEIERTMTMFGRNNIFF